MAKFAKLKLNGFNGTSTQWALIIDNEDDLAKYHEHDAYLNANAFLGLNREGYGSDFSHAGGMNTREVALGRYLNAVKIGTPEGVKIHPLVEVANITDAKYLGQLRYIREIGAIRINESGGYCGLTGFLNIWKGEIVEWIEKDDFGFPIEDEAMECDTIILENAHPDYSMGEHNERKAKSFVENPGTIKTVYNLMEVDRKYIFECLSKCKNVVISSQLQNESQVDAFMAMFAKLSKKNVYLILSEKAKVKIKSHPLFQENNQKHNISILDTSSF